MILYETLLQPITLLIICVAGFGCGLIFDFANFLFFICKKKRVARHILDFFATLIVALIFFILILNVSYGEIRLWHILFFIASLLLERASIGKLVAKYIYMCYNFFIDKIKKLRTKKIEKK